MTGSFTPAERLVLLCTLVAPTDLERAELAALARGADVDWSEFDELTRAGATVPLVLSRLDAEDLGHLVPTGVRAALDSVAGTIAGTNQRRLAAAIPMLRALDTAGVHCVVLKGMLFADEVYRDPHYKRMNDIDTLIRVEDVDAVLKVYSRLDLFSVSAIFGKEPRAQVTRSHHLPTFVSPDGDLLVGTHWGLITPKAGYTVDMEAIWSRVRVIDFHGVPARAMSHEDNLHHLCIHLPYYKTGLRELADIWNLVRFAGESLDVDLLEREIRKAGTEDLVFHALSLVERLIPHPVTEDLLARVRPDASAWYRYDVPRKTRDVHVLLRNRSTHTSVVEKAYTEFNATGDLGEKLRAFSRLWGALLAVPRDEALRMSSLPRSSGPAATTLARLAGPYRLTRVFQRDLGRWLFPAALVKTVVDLGVAGLRTARGDLVGHVDLAAFAAANGTTVGDLRRIMESQE